MPADHVDLVSLWRIHADAERVWHVLADASTWPGWWPCARAVRAVRAGTADGLGTVHRVDWAWATRLPVRLSMEIEVIELVKGERLRTRSRGPLEGEALWLLRAAPGHTDVTCVWRMRFARRWLRGLAPLLAPALRWNHAAVMRAGEAGLRHGLQASAPRAAG